MESMIGALSATESSIPEALAAASMRRYQEVTRGEGGRENALALLAADALLTHAFQAQAEIDPNAIAAFARKWGEGGVLGEIAHEAADNDTKAPPYLAEVDECRLAEKEQAQFYRSLAVQAEALGDDQLSQRFHELHADEQHHFSRLTARMLEFGRAPEDGPRRRPPEISLDGWEPIARSREEAEIQRYSKLLGSDLDARTDALVRDILQVENHHAEELGGKWTKA